MRQAKSIKLSIAKPCSEDWNEMALNQGGRHCQNCKKTVVDFSGFTDKQLFDFFSKVKGSVCGRLSNLQIERQLAYSAPSRYLFLQKLLFGTVFTAGLVGSANANYNPNSKPLLEQYGNKLGVNEGEERESLLAANIDSANYIKGTLIDSDNKEALPFAAVALECNGVQIGSAMTDINGRFSILVPNEYIGKRVMLKAVYPGYKDISIEINKIQLPLTIELKSSEVIMGGVITISRYTNLQRNNPDKQVIRKGDTPYW